MCHFHCLIDSRPGTGDVAAKSRRVGVDPIRNRRCDGVQASERLAVTIPAGGRVGSVDGRDVPLSQAATTSQLPSCRADFRRGPGW